MTLDLLVPRYHEPWEIVKPLLDSIRLQDCIDFADVGMIIVNDGEDDRLDESVFTEYPFRITQFGKPHAGVSACRNYALDNSTADYVMFCDADDHFLSTYGLHLIFSAMQERYDAITSVFIEEHKDKDGKYSIVRKERDATFVHGKVYRRGYLYKNNLRFKESLTLHEDGYFTCLALLCTERRKNIETPFYIWKWRDGSAADKGNDLFILQTYDHIMRMRAAICKECRERGYLSDYGKFVRKTVIDSYYDFQKPMWRDPKNKTDIENAEKAFARFYSKFRGEYLRSKIDDIAETMTVSRMNAYKNGLHVEQQTITEWLNHIVKDVRI